MPVSIKDVVPISKARAQFAELAEEASIGLLCIFLTACGADPADVTIRGLDGVVKQGDSRVLTAEVKDADGALMADVELAWTLDSEPLADNTAIFSDEGSHIVRVTAGRASAQVVLAVASPLTGEWERQSQPLRGMKMRIGARGETLAAEITLAPPANDEARAWRLENTLSLMTKEQKALIDRDATVRKFVNAMAEKGARCNGEYFAKGLLKFKDISRIDADRWEATSLRRGPVTNDPDVAACEATEMLHDSTTEFVLSKDGSMSIQDIANADEAAGSRQLWAYVGP
jgi:hypothetical protein